jgi:AcrR family transcriptional regulator
MNTPVQKRRKATQRERLVDGMIAAANRDGYAGASVSAVIAAAGVSRPTFYDYFQDRDDCFVASITDVQERHLADVLDTIAANPPERALSAAIEATVGFANSQPAEARFLMKEALAGGPAALDARDAGIREIANAIERALKKVAAETSVPDLPTGAVVGAVHRVLASRLRRGERALGGLQADLLQWIESYAAPAGEHRWRTLKPTAAPERSPLLPPVSLRPPLPLPPGRPRIPEEEIVENHRQRIMFATAQVVQERGYTAATVSEIFKRAAVDGRHFYRLFGEKQEAFSAIHEVGFQYLMAAAAGAFFAGESWPERIWEAFRAASQSIDDTPTFAHVAFVEAYAVGPRAIQRVEDSRIAFTIFLQEGYRSLDERPAPSREALEAIITTIFEIVYLEARASRTPCTAGLLAHIVHMCLVPFIGVAATNEFLEGKRARGGGARGGRERKSSGRTRKRS